jgi:Rrf2 family iron-sulfur cluster assembly transcriptional regulator
MMLTTKGRYAVMAIVDMAQQNRFMQDKPVAVSLSDISSRQDITVAYLEQIFGKLKKAKLVKSIRGPGGGYILTKSSENINIAEIIVAVDESIKMVRCENDPKTGCMNKKSRCATHDLWENLGEQIKSYLSSITVKDVLTNHTNKITLFINPEKQRKSEVKVKVI